MTEAATQLIKTRLEASKRVEAELRAAGRHADADLLRGLRVGYGSAIETCKRLHRDNMALRTSTAPAFEKGGGE